MVEKWWRGSYSPIFPQWSGKTKDVRQHLSLKDRAETDWTKRDGPRSQKDCRSKGTKVYECLRYPETSRVLCSWNRLKTGACQQDLVLLSSFGSTVYVCDFSSCPNIKRHHLNADFWLLLKQPEVLNHTPPSFMAPISGAETLDRLP